VKFIAPEGQNISRNELKIYFEAPSGQYEKIFRPDGALQT
jgi:hypothetical protein